MRRREKGGFVYLYMEAMVTCARHHFISFPRFFFSFWVWASSFLLCPRGTFAIASPLCVASLCMPRGTFCLCTNPKARIYMSHEHVCVHESWGLALPCVIYPCLSCEPICNSSSAWKHKISWHWIINLWKMLLWLCEFRGKGLVQKLGSRLDFYWCVLNNRVAHIFHG